MPFGPGGMRTSSSISPNRLELSSRSASVPEGAAETAKPRWISTLEYDAKLIEQLAQTIGNKKLEGSYEVMAFLFAHTSAIQRLFIANTVFVVIALPKVSSKGRPT